MMTQVNPRAVYATNIQNEILKKPAAIQNLICAIADECSMADLERIYVKFINSLKTTQDSLNISN